MRSKGKSAVKGDPKESGSRVKVKGDTRERDRRTQMSLTRVKREERNLTLGGVKRKEPLFGPGVNGVQSLLNRRSGLSNRRVRGPHSKIICIERNMHRRRKQPRDVINEEKKKDRTKNRALRDTIANTKVTTAVSVKVNRRTTIRKEGLGPPHKARWQTQREELVKEGRVPNRVEGGREVHGGKDGTKRGFGRMKAIRDRLSKNKNLVKSRATRAEARLERRKKRIVFDKERKTGKNETLKELAGAGSKGNGTIGRRRVKRFARFRDGNNRRGLPKSWDIMGSPRKIKDVKKKRERSRGKMTEKRIGDEIWTTSGRRGQRGNSGGKLGKSERRADGGGGRIRGNKITVRFTKSVKKRNPPGAMKFGSRTGDD